MRADRAMREGTANSRIDLAAPPRSVRRAAAPPRYKADLLNSAPIRHPGAVPFVWEKRPGQPKSVRTRRAPPPTPPRDTLLTRAEDVAGSPYHDALGEFVGPFPELRGVGADDGSRTGAAAPRKEEDEVVTAEEEAKDEMKRQEAPPAAVPRKQQGDGGEEEEERFSDALDTLSRSESLTMNCSVSGLSGVPGAAPPGPEPGARGVMMDRFLPAAHAVAVGSPQYTFRKAGATGNSGRDHARATASGTGNLDDRTRRAPVQLPHQHLPPNYFSCTYQRREGHDEEEDDDDDDYDVRSNRGFSSKGCGLLPGLCVKTSMLLLNPVPAMKRGKAQGRGRGRQFPSKGPSPLARSSPNRPIGCDSKTPSWEDVYKHKLEQKYLGQAEDGRSKLTSESNQLTFWSDSQTGDGSSPFHHSITGGTSPYHSYAAMSPSSKANESFRTEDRNERSRGSNVSGSLGRDHDRSSFVGSDHSSFKGSSSMSSGLDTTGHEDSMDHRGDIDPEISHLGLLLDTKVNGSQPQGQQTVRRNSSVKNQDEDLLTEKISETGESTNFKHCGNPGMTKLDDRKHSTRGAHQEATLHSDKNGIAERENISLQSLLPLPAPKSPAESWLSRTLPSVANKPHMPSFLGIKVQAKKQAPWASSHPKDNDQKPSRTRIIRFADVVEKPTSLKSEM